MVGRERIPFSQWSLCMGHVDLFFWGKSSYQNFQQPALKTHVVRVSLLKQGWKATKRLPRNALRKSSEKQQKPKSVQSNTGWLIWICTLKTCIL